MKKLLLTTMICFYSAQAWNPFEKKESTARKYVNKAREVISPLAPLGMQVVGGLVIPIAILFAAKTSSDVSEKAFIGTIIASTLVSTGYNVYQLHQSKKGKKRYETKPLVYAGVNQLLILGAPCFWYGATR